MKNFRIIPVLDLLNSTAVHAIKGERAKYKPLKPIFINSSNPIKISKVLLESFKFEEIYIADLNSIMLNGSNLNQIKQIINQTKAKILLDPGIRDKENIVQIFNIPINKLILGIETINNLDLIKKALDIYGPKNILISIDMYDKRVLSPIKEFKNGNPMDLTKVLGDLGVKDIILLDLYRVGQKMGGIPPIYIKIKNQFKGNILVGIGTALYDGTLSKNQIEKMN
ncbi:MAG: HisA/HisF-related TIM barrel protein [Candidatus Lokiarchaeota archaeon]